MVKALQTAAVCVILHSVRGKPGMVYLIRLSHPVPLRPGWHWRRLRFRYVVTGTPDGEGSGFTAVGTLVEDVYGATATFTGCRGVRPGDAAWSDLKRRNIEKVEYLDQSRPHSEVLCKYTHAHSLNHWV